MRELTRGGRRKRSSAPFASGGNRLNPYGGDSRGANPYGGKLEEQQRQSRVKRWADEEKADDRHAKKRPVDTICEVLGSWEYQPRYSRPQTWLVSPRRYYFEVSRYYIHLKLAFDVLDKITSSEAEERRACVERDGIAYVPILYGESMGFGHLAGKLARAIRAHPDRETRIRLAGQVDEIEHRDEERIAAIAKADVQLAEVPA